MTVISCFIHKIFGALKAQECKTSYLCVYTDNASALRDAYRKASGPSGGQKFTCKQSNHFQMTHFRQPKSCWDFPCSFPSKKKDYTQTDSRPYNITSFFNTNFYCFAFSCTTSLYHFISVLIYFLKKSLNRRARELNFSEQDMSDLSKRRKDHRHSSVKKSKNHKKS